MQTEVVKPLSAEEITELCLRHTLYDWSAQAGIKPMPIASAKGVRFQTVDGRRFIDFNSQLMCVNAGHGDRRIIDAIKAQADRLPYISPFMATEARARLGGITHYRLLKLVSLSRIGLVAEPGLTGNSSMPSGFATMGQPVSVCHQ